MFHRRFLISTVLCCVAGLGMAHAYLPADRFAWWEATPPPTRGYTRHDTVDTFFNEPILHTEDFDANNGWSTHPLVSVRRFDGNPGQLVQRQVSEEGQRVTRLVLEVAPGPGDGESPGTSPADEAPVVLDFATPQRAVAIQFGLLCNEEVGCESSQGQRGVDAAGIELWAFDERHSPLVIATVPLNWDETIVEGRTDYLIGLRDAEARIHRVELRLGVENFRTGRRIRANPMLRKIYHEALPHAAVMQLEVPVGQPVVLDLPYRFDQATAIVRGFHVRETTVFAMTGFAFRVDASVANGQVTLTAQGTTKTEVSKTSTPAETVYASLIGWDSAQVELLTQDNLLVGRGQTHIDRDRWVLDPCRFNACGPPSGNQGWPGVVMSAGVDFDQVDDSVDNTLWHLFLVDQDPTWNRDLTQGLMQLFMAADVQRDGDHPTFALDMTRRLLTGRSVVETTTRHPNGPIPVPNFVTQSNDRAWHYTPNTMESLGYYCGIDAPVAAVGARVFLLNTSGTGNPVQLQRGFMPEEIDMEIHGQFTIDRGFWRVRVGGKIQNATALNGHLVTGQVFVTPACVGIRPVHREAVPIVHGARFASLVGRRTGPEEVGRIYNMGPGAVTITDAAFDGDTAPFDLSVKVNGQFFAPLGTLGGNVSILLRAGDTLEIDGFFAPQVTQQANAVIQFKTDLPGQQVLAMPVSGRIPATAEWLPTPINFGLVEDQTSASRNTLLQVPDIVPVQVYRFRVDNDPENNFSTIPEPAYQNPQQPGPILQPGEATLVQVLFHPTTLGPGGAADPKQADVVAETDVGDLVLKVMGEAVPPPEPLPELSRSQVQFGLVPTGQSDDYMVTLTNWGAGLLRITNVQLTGDSAFEALPAPNSFPQALRHEETFDFRIQFNSALPDGMKYGELTITTNAGDLVLPINGYSTP